MLIIYIPIVSKISFHYFYVDKLYIYIYFYFSLTFQLNKNFTNKSNHKIFVTFYHFFFFFFSNYPTTHGQHQRTESLLLMVASFKSDGKPQWGQPSTQSTLDDKIYIDQNARFHFMFHWDSLRWAWVLFQWDILEIN